MEGSIESVMRDLARNYLEENSCNYDTWDEIHIIKVKNDQT